MNPFALTPRHVLGISVDQTLVGNGSQIAGDSRFHMLAVGEATAEYHVLVYSGDSRAPCQVADNVWVHATGSHSKAHFFRDAARIGSRICRERGIEVLYTQDLYATAMVGWWLKQRLGIPMCAAIAGDMIGNELWRRESMMNRVWDRVGRFMIPRCDAIRVLSTSEEEKLRAFGVPPERIWRVNNVLDLRRFAGSEANDLRQGWLGDGKYDSILLFVGRLVPQKSLDVLLRAMTHILQRHPKTLLVIAGDGPLRIEMESMVRELGLADHVYFAGAVPLADGPRYYAAADVFVLSSAYEGFARVLLEAAASRKPMVVTETSGTRDIIRDGETGFVIPQRDEIAFADRVSQLLADPELRQRMGDRAGTEVLERYAPAPLQAQFRAMFDYLAG